MFLPFSWRSGNQPKKLLLGFLNQALEQMSKQLQTTFVIFSVTVSRSPHRCLMFWDVKYWAHCSWWKCQVHYVCICNESVVNIFRCFLKGIQVSDAHRRTDSTQAWYIVFTVFIVIFLSIKNCLMQGSKSFGCLCNSIFNVQVHSSWWCNHGTEILKVIVKLNLTIIDHYRNCILITDFSSNYHQFCLRNTDRESQCHACLLVNDIYLALSQQHNDWWPWVLHHHQTDIHIAGSRQHYLCIS